MLSIGEFSNICRVSAKTLRYYAEIGLILPDKINPETDYRYYAIRQLERMLFISRLKSYNLSLEEIKAILESEELQDEKLFRELTRKKKEIELQVRTFKKSLDQLDNDLSNLKEGRSIMSYLQDIAVQLVEVLECISFLSERWFTNTNLLTNMKNASAAWSGKSLQIN